MAWMIPIVAMVLQACYGPSATRVTAAPARGDSPRLSAEPAAREVLPANGALVGPDSCTLSGSVEHDGHRTVPLRVTPDSAAYAEILPLPARGKLTFTERGGGLVWASLSLMGARLEGWVPASNAPVRSRIGYADWLTITSSAAGIWVGQTGSDLRVRYDPTPFFELARPIEVTVRCSGDLGQQGDAPVIEAPQDPTTERLVLDYVGLLRASAGGALLARLHLTKPDRVPIWITERQGSDVHAIIAIPGFTFRGWLDGRALRLGDVTESIGVGTIGTPKGCDAGETRECSAELSLFAATKERFIRVGSTKKCTPFVINSRREDYSQVCVAGVTASQLFVSKTELQTSCPNTGNPPQCPELQGGSHAAKRLRPHTKHD